MAPDPTLEALLVQAGRHHLTSPGAVVPALQPSTTFARDEAHALRGPHLYSRYGSPNDTEVEHLLGAAEGAAGALAFASGMAAIACVLEGVPKGRQVFAPSVMYFAARHWIERAAEAGRFHLTLYDNSRTDGLADALTGRTADLVWVETPANPAWHVTDIAEAARLAHAAGAILAVDGTCAPPCTTRALSLGADIVMHSATKYLNGHSDVTAGVLAFADPEARARYEPTRRYMGAHLGAFEAWLLVRGLRTLWVRFARQSETALRLSSWLEAHPAVEGVSYPGLASHPHHAVAARQMTGGFGGMLSIHVKGGFAAAQALVTGTNTFINATSLGSVESLIEHRRAVEGPASTTQEGLVRLSVGLESFEVLQADLTQALNRVILG